MRGAALILGLPCLLGLLWPSSEARAVGTNAAVERPIAFEVLADDLSLRKEASRGAEIVAGVPAGAWLYPLHRRTPGEETRTLRALSRRKLNRWTVTAPWIEVEDDGGSRGWVFAGGLSAPFLVEEGNGERAAGIRFYGVSAAGHLVLAQAADVIRFPYYTLLVDDWLYDVDLLHGFGLFSKRSGLLLRPDYLETPRPENRALIRLGVKRIWDVALVSEPTVEGDPASIVIGRGDAPLLPGIEVPVARLRYGSRSRVVWPLAPTSMKDLPNCHFVHGSDEEALRDTSCPLRLWSASEASATITSRGFFKVDGMKPALALLCLSGSGRDQSYEGPDWHDRWPAGPCRFIARRNAWFDVVPVPLRAKVEPEAPQEGRARHLAELSTLLRALVGGPEIDFRLRIALGSAAFSEDGGASVLSSASGWLKRLLALYTVRDAPSSQREVLHAMRGTRGAPDSIYSRALAAFVRHWLLARFDEARGGPEPMLLGKRQAGWIVHVLPTILGSLRASEGFCRWRRELRLFLRIWLALKQTPGLDAAREAFEQAKHGVDLRSFAANPFYLAFLLEHQLDLRAGTEIYGARHNLQALGFWFRRLSAGEAEPLAAVLERAVELLDPSFDPRPRAPLPISAHHFFDPNLGELRATRRFVDPAYLALTRACSGGRMASENTSGATDDEGEACEAAWGPVPDLQYHFVPSDGGPEFDGPLQRAKLWRMAGDHDPDPPSAQCAGFEGTNSAVLREVIDDGGYLSKVLVPPPIARQRLVREVNRRYEAAMKAIVHGDLALFEKLLERGLSPFSIRLPENGEKAVEGSTTVLRLVIQHIRDGGFGATSGRLLGAILDRQPDVERFIHETRLLSRLPIDRESNLERFLVKRLGRPLVFGPQEWSLGPLTPTWERPRKGLGRVFEAIEKLFRKDPVKAHLKGMLRRGLDPREQSPATWARLVEEHRDDGGVWAEAIRRWPPGPGAAGPEKAPSETVTCFDLPEARCTEEFMGTWTNARCCLKAL